MIKYVKKSDLQNFIQEIFHSQVNNYQIKILPENNQHYMMQVIANILKILK